MPPEPEENTPPVEEQNEGTSLMDRVQENRSFLIGILAAMAVMGLCLIPLFVFFLLRGGGGVLGGGAEPTPFVTAVSAGLPLNDSLVVGIGPSDTVSVTLDIPQTLTMNGRSYTVQPQVVPADGTWSPNLEADTAGWVYGSIINYVFALADTEENHALLEMMEPGDEIKMVTQSGTPFTFSFNSRELVPATDRDIYAQNVPGTTIILTGAEEQDRLVVNGRYVVSDTASNFQANTCEVGETCQVGNLQFTVTGAAYDPSRAEAPTGFAFYRIDYQVENVGSSVVDSNNLRLSLTDDIGNQYAMNPLASQSGNFPVLSGPLNANQRVQATAGYQIPASLESQTVQWVIVDVESGDQLQVIIDYGGGSQAAEQTSITLIGATISNDQSALVMDGQITNLGTQQVVVTNEDLSLRTGDGASFLLLATNPDMPWTVPPGQTLQFFVRYQNPQAETAVFTVLNQSFQLDFVR
jgi:hypothetical protein